MKIISALLLTFTLLFASLITLAQTPASHEWPGPKYNAMQTLVNNLVQYDIQYKTDGTKRAGCPQISLANCKTQTVCAHSMIVRQAEIQALLSHTSCQLPSMHTLQTTDLTTLNALYHMINNQGFYALAIFDYPDSGATIQLKYKKWKFEDPIQSKFLGSLESNSGYVLTNPTEKYEVFMTY